MTVKDKGKAPLRWCMPKCRVVVILGSEHDHTFAAPIKSMLDQFGVPCEFRVASAHKDSERLLSVLEEYESLNDTMVYVTVAGMSNALSGFVDFKTKHPVIACPRQSTELWNIDIYSSLRMPRGVAPLVSCDPENAAIAAVKILGESERKLAVKVKEYHHQMQLNNENADEKIRRRGT